MILNYSAGIWHEQNSAFRIFGCVLLLDLWIYKGSKAIAFSCRQGCGETTTVTDTRDGCKVQHRANIDYYCCLLSNQCWLVKSPPTPMTPPFLLPFLHPEAFAIRNDNSHGLNLDGLLETHVLNTSSQLVKPLGLKTWLAGTSSQGQGWDSKVISAPISL